MTHVTSVLDRRVGLHVFLPIAKEAPDEAHDPAAHLPATLRGMAERGGRGHLHNRARVDAHMDGEVNIYQGPQIHILVAAKTTGVNTDEGHEPRGKPQKLAGEYLKEEEPRLEWRPALRMELGVVGLFERQYGRLMDVDVVGMAIPADWVEGEYSIGLELPDVFHDFPRHLVNGMRHLCIGVLVIGSAGHARITVAKEEDFLDTDVLGSATKLGFAQLGDRLEVTHVLGVHSTDLASGGADQVDIVAASGVEGQG